MKNYIKPDWPAPKNIRSYTTTRFHEKGASLPPYDNFNLATHVADDNNSVLQNRFILTSDLNLPAEPSWLKQEHTTHVIKLEKNLPYNETIADASFTIDNNIVCAVLTADCLPILLTDNEGSVVAAIHAGWKGLAAGIIEATVKSLPSPAKKIMAWMGPAIGPTAFVVGDDVKREFIAYDNAATMAFTTTEVNGKWLGNIYLLGKQRLNSVGVTEIYGGELCTYSEPTKFYSFRRDGVTGRMATLIYKHENNL